MKSLRDDSLPIDVTRDDPIHRQGKIFTPYFRNVTITFYVMCGTVLDQLQKKKNRISLKAIIIV